MLTRAYRHGSGGCISVAVDERILAESVFEGMHGLHSSSSRMEEGFAISVFYGDSLTLKMEYDFPSFFISDCTWKVDIVAFTNQNRERFSSMHWL